MPIFGGARKMEWKRRLAFLLACLVIPFLLISCGGREEEGGVAEPEGAKEETAETSPGVIAHVDGFDIWIVDVESGDKSMVTDSPYRDYAPSISPDGARIAFTREDESRNVFIVNCDGTGLERLTRGTPGDDFSPAWSPRGDTLAYLSARDHPEEGLPYAEVYLMDPDGGNQRRLSASEHGLENPGALWWSPEGDEIAVWEMGSGAGTGIALVDVSTGEVSRPERLYRILEERGYLQSAVYNYVLNPRNVDLAACTLADLASAPTGESTGCSLWTWPTETP
jgi:dipeptidyl aminopeptidase/acylaminoacyl peptidase